MTHDFYCDEVLSGRTAVQKVIETEQVLTFYHTRPFYLVHIVIIPKQHIESLTALESSDDDLILELLVIIKKIAAQIVAEHGACRVVTNMGGYQESKHLHFHVIHGAMLKQPAI
jgi:histidine triad (HIT) family protein